jgi:hypothetical protein
MKYTLKTVNDWTHPYYFSKDKDDYRLYREKNVCVQETEYEDMLLTMVKDWLDAPGEPMNDEAVRKEFDSDKRKIAQKFVEQIKRYYNARLNMFNEFKAFFEENKDVPGAKFRKDIPYEFNHFETDDEPDPFRDNETQNESYFEITVNS